MRRQGSWAYSSRPPFAHHLWLDRRRFDHQLFIATIVPGILVALSFAIVHFFRSRALLPDGRETVAPDKSPGIKGSVSRGKTISALFMPVLVLGGIYGGLFTPTEAAAAACIYAIVVVVLQRSLSPRA
jgi:C4-dicarboxylate transporter DctM subunit